MKALTSILHPIRKWWTSSISRQFVLTSGLTALALILLISGFVYQRQREFLHQQGLNHTAQLARALSASSTSWALAHDLVGLQEIARGFVNTDDLKFAAVVSLKGEVLSSTLQGQVGLYFTDPLSSRLLTAPPELQVLLNSPDLIDLAAPIMAGARHIGWVRVEMTQENANRYLKSLLMAGLLFILTATLVMVGIASGVARRLTQRLHNLLAVVSQVASGKTHLKAPTSGSDEMSQLAIGFNHMLDKLDQGHASVERRNTELGIFNNVLNLISTDRPLSEILNELTRQIHQLESAPCTLFILDGAQLTLLANSGIPPELQSVLASLPLQNKVGTSVEAINEGKRVFVKNIQAAPHWQPFLDWLRHEGLHSAWSEPFRRADGKLLGVFSLYRKPETLPSEAEMQLIERCAQLAGLAIEHHEKDEQLRIAATAFETQEGMYIMSSDRTILQVNRAFTAITGYLPDEVIGKPVSTLRSGDEPPDFYDSIWSAVDRAGSWQGEIRNRRKNGEPYPKWLTLTAVRKASGEISHYVGGFFDITARKDAAQEIERLAFYDPLTNLPNRRLLFDQLQHQLSVCRRLQRHGALLILDLDNFKTLNDSKGHDFGDKLLKQTADRLQKQTRNTDIVARLGGDEFVVMLTDLNADTDVASHEAEHVASKLLNTLDTPYHLDDTIVHSTASIGITLLGHDTLSIEDLLKRADMALYRAKAAGRNTFRFFDPGMQATVTARLALETDFREALTQHAFELYYQPQVDEQSRMVGVEALVRWNHPTQGLISPAKFIPMAEETGLILPLGSWILETALKQLALWQNRPDMAHLTISVNVSARQFRQPSFVKNVLEAIERTRAPADRLKLELTESMFLENLDETITKMLTLKGCGLSFSLDDFGTGYSSLNYLKRLPLDQLKIDSSFVRDAPNSRNEAAIVQTIIALGRSLGMNVIAEGVETEEQKAFLSRHGCHLYQGYLFGRPAPVAALESVLDPELTPSASDATVR